MISHELTYNADIIQLLVVVLYDSGHTYIAESMLSYDGCCIDLLLYTNNDDAPMMPTIVVHVLLRWQWCYVYPFPHTNNDE